MMYNFSLEDSMNATNIDQYELNFDDLVETLQTMAEKVVEDKEKLPLFNLATFSSSFPKTMENVKAVTGTILDFDECLVPWQTISAAFKDVTHIIINSYNNGIKGKGQRFRMIIPYSKPLTIENFGNSSHGLKMAYTQIFDIMYHEIHNLILEGASDDNPTATGIDLSKMNANAFYFCPSKTEHSIFHVNHAKFLNPLWLLSQPKYGFIIKQTIKREGGDKRSFNHTFESDANKTVSKDKVQQYIQRWFNTNSAKLGANGHDNFWAFGDYLWYCRVEVEDIEDALHQHYHRFAHPSERLGEIKGNINKIRMKGKRL